MAQYLKTLMILILYYKHTCKLKVFKQFFHNQQLICYYQVILFVNIFHIFTFFEKSGKNCLSLSAKAFRNINIDCVNSHNLFLLCRLERGIAGIVSPYQNFCQQWYFENFTYSIIYLMLFQRESAWRFSFSLFLPQLSQSTQRSLMIVGIFISLYLLISCLYLPFQTHIHILNRLYSNIIFMHITIK